jgi:hypothetical protein
MRLKTGPGHCADALRKEAGVGLRPIIRLSHEAYSPTPRDRPSGQLGRGAKDIGCFDLEIFGKGRGSTAWVVWEENASEPSPVAPLSGE